MNGPFTMDEDPDHTVRPLFPRRGLLFKRVPKAFLIVDYDAQLASRFPYGMLFLSAVPHAAPAAAATAAAATAADATAAAATAAAATAAAATAAAAAVAAAATTTTVAAAATAATVS